MVSTNQHNTIFLTPEEAERMRNTFKGRLHVCQDVSGQSRVPDDTRRRQNQIEIASLLSDIAGAPISPPKGPKNSPDTMVAYAVGHPYPPCTLSTQELQPMRMSDLQLDTHHRGRMLIVRRVAPVVKLVASSWTIVEEEWSGETERLEILLHNSKHGQDILELDSLFKIKEPYFTLSEQGDPTIRIDHPSDFVASSDNLGNSPHPSAKQSSLGSAVPAPALMTLKAKTAKKCKEDGNDALQQRNLLLAHANYTQGLHFTAAHGTKKDDLVRDLFRNRAHVNLGLGRFDEAKDDAIASLTRLEDQTHKVLDSKAYFRAGCAAYNLGQFLEAKRCFEEHQKLTPGHKEAAARLRKAELRLQEQATGVYNFTKINAGVSTARPRVDTASFTCNVKIGKSPGRGRGLFATQDIGAGDIILCEKAFCVVWDHEEEALTAMTYDFRDDRIRVFPAGLCKAIIQKLLDNPSQIDKVMDLYGDYQGIDKQLIMRDSNPVVDAFQIHDIVSRNAFGPGSVSSSRLDEGDISNASAGLWIMASYSNHSCMPNSKKESFGDLIVLRATRPIKAGDELTHSYDVSSDYDARAAKLMDTWGFICTCSLCIAEKSVDLALRKKRRQLEGEADALLERSTAVGAGRLDISRARRLANSINETYDEERYKGLPRIALLRIQEWLRQATLR